MFLMPQSTIKNTEVQYLNIKKILTIIKSLLGDLITKINNNG